MVTALGPHVVDFMYADGRDQRGLVLRVVKETQPAWVNVLRAAQPAEALQTALEIRRDHPLTRVMVRHHFGPLGAGDERVMQVFRNPADYYRDVVAQYRGLDVTLVAGNEIVTDWQTYGVYFAEVARLAGLDGVSLALCRAPSWHPYREHFGTFDWLGEALARWPIHKFSPNVYWTRQPEENLDALWKMLELWTRLGKPETVIGEFARIYNYDPYAGYHAEGISDRQAADEVVNLVRDELAPRGIAALWYSLGNWPLRSSTFHTPQGYVDVVRERMGDMVLAKRQSVGGGQMFDVVTTATPSLRLRALPVSGGVVASLVPGTKLRVTDGIPAIVGTDAWLGVSVLDGAHAGRSGFVSAQWVALPSDVPEPEPEPEPNPEMMPVEEHLALMDAFRVKCADMQERALSEALGYIDDARRRLQEMQVERETGRWE